jgi:hypothetical protein
MDSPSSYVLPKEGNSWKSSKSTTPIASEESTPKLKEEPTTLKTSEDSSLAKPHVDQYNPELPKISKDEETKSAFRSALNPLQMIPKASHQEQFDYGGLNWVLSTIYEDSNFGESLSQLPSGELVYIPIVE